LAGLRAKHTAEVVRGLAFHHGALPGELFNEKAASHGCYLAMKQPIGSAGIPPAEGAFRRALAGRMPALPEDVFDFVKEGGVSVGGLVVHFQRGVKLLHDLPLLARQLCGRQHTYMIVKIAAAAAMRVG